MNAERDCLDPAMRSIPVSTSFESVIDVFSFILLSYHQHTTQRIVKPKEGYKTRLYPLICPSIARASAAGSAASVIGRPTTIWLAPEAIASAGVTTRT